MQINVTTDYAIRIVLYLAIQNKVTTSKDIAMTMAIPGMNSVWARRFS